MAMVRMTAKEMREKYPLTPERIKELELLSHNEPDLSDPDNPELDEEFWEKAHKPRLKSVKTVQVQIDSELFNRASAIGNLMHLEQEKVLASALNLGLAKMEAMSV
jgi:hypothetical protein